VCVCVCVSVCVWTFVCIKHSRALAIFFCPELLHFGFQLGSSVVAGYPTLADGRRRRRTHGQDIRTGGQPDGQEPTQAHPGDQLASTHSQIFSYQHEMRKIAVHS